MRPLVSQINKLLIKLAEEKAKNLNAVLILSDFYSALDANNMYTKTKYYVYISKSKAGNQYFDSLDGSAYISDEGSYRYNSFLIRQEDIK